MRPVTEDTWDSYQRLEQRTVGIGGAYLMGAPDPRKLDLNPKTITLFAPRPGESSLPRLA
jgi:hypothetical protein